MAPKTQAKKGQIATTSTNVEEDAPSIQATTGDNASTIQGEHDNESNDLDDDEAREICAITSHNYLSVDSRRKEESNEGSPEAKKKDEKMVFNGSLVSLRGDVTKIIAYEPEAQQLHEQFSKVEGELKEGEVIMVNMSFDYDHLPDVLRNILSTVHIYIPLFRSSLSHAFTLIQSFIQSFTLSILR
jgi:hypothetical protein